MLWIETDKTHGKTSVPNIEIRQGSAIIQETENWNRRQTTQTQSCFFWGIRNWKTEHEGAAK